MLYPMILFFVIGSIVLINTIRLIKPFYSRSMVLGLDWPKKQDYYGMKARVNKYFRLNGWRVVPVTHTLVYDFFVYKDNFEVVVKCLTTGYTYTPITIRDLSSVKLRDLRGKPFICIAAEQPRADYVEDLLKSGVRIIYYKDLKDFIALDPRNLKTPQEGLKSSAEKLVVKAET